MSQTNVHVLIRLSTFEYASFVAAKKRTRIFSLLLWPVFYPPTISKKDRLCKSIKIKASNPQLVSCDSGIH